MANSCDRIVLIPSNLPVRYIVFFISGPINASDFECILCSQCLLDPVTTTCGHTFCRSCLARVLDHGLSCPLCMDVLRATDLNRKTTQVLVNALQVLLPEVYKKCTAASRTEISFSEENSQVPVFVCTNAFPGVACPLFVYEPRYRLLTRRCLQSNNKKFAMAVNTKSNSSCGNVEKFASYGTILEVRDAVYMSDGTSILSTVGLERFRVVNRGEKDGYDTAEIQYIRDMTIPSDKLQAVLLLHTHVRTKAVSWLQSLNPIVFKEIERSLGPMPEVEENWTRLPDGPRWIWWLVPILPLSSQLQLGFLSSVSIEKRLRAVEKLLDHLTDRNRMVISDSAVKCVTTTITTPTTSTTTTTANHSCHFFERESRENTASAIDVL
ncbi:LON peptidase N-terminal domain and RING finger protein 1-like [Agrilus planipennis]|uniref:LON peptidase N-terminal domain and RING finger protein 1-like n=2 Tax=Agrilus planipennis TaxID=224129 RepID=A0A7F5QUU7_AGRPL|nr:LON peptidase N-terminal domain and RING finger protein 1-like [Agrilus planipennis]